MPPCIVSCIVSCAAVHLRDIFRCYTLQHTTTTYCNTLQHRNTLQPAATRCSTLQHAATRCNTLRHTATRCNTLQTRCKTLHHTASHCNTLQCTATHCNTLLILCRTCACAAALRGDASGRAHEPPQPVRSGWAVGAPCAPRSCESSRVFLRSLCLFCRYFLLAFCHNCNTAAHCNTLQHTATHCNTLRCRSVSLVGYFRGVLAFFTGNFVLH